MNPGIFREYDIRGIAGKDLTDDDVVNIGKAAGTYLIRKGCVKIMVGAARDAIRIMEDESGAEYFSAFCETWHSITQFICFKRWGWKIAGIFPGQFTRWRRDNLEYRGCTVHFYKLVKKGLEFATGPSDWKLLPEVRELWETLEEINKAACCEPSQKNDS